MYVCIYIYIYVCMYTCMYVHIHIHIHNIYMYTTQTQLNPPMGAHLFQGTSGSRQDSSTLPYGGILLH